MCSTLRVTAFLITMNWVLPLHQGNSINWEYHHCFQCFFPICYLLAIHVIAFFYKEFDVIWGCFQVVKLWAEKFVNIVNLSILSKICQWAKHLSINCSSLYINIPYDNFPDSSRDAFSFLYIALHLSCELGFKCQISSVDIRGIWNILSLEACDWV